MYCRPGVNDKSVLGNETVDDGVGVAVEVASLHVNQSHARVILPRRTFLVPQHHGSVSQFPILAQFDGICKCLLPFRIPHETTLNKVVKTGEYMCIEYFYKFTGMVSY